MSRRIRIAVAAGTGIILMTLAGGTGLLLSRTAHAARRTAEASLERSAQAMESTLNRQLLQVDGALASLPALLTGTVAGGPLTPAAAASQLLRGLNFQTFAFRDLLLVGADGAVWAATRPRGSTRNLPFSLADAARGTEGGSSAILGPLRNRVTGDWSLYVARPVSVPGLGEYLAVAEVPVPVLTRLLAETGLGPGVRVLVERRGGQLIASLPHDEMRIGQVRQHAPDTRRADGHAFAIPGGPGAGETMAVVRASLYSDILVVLNVDDATALADWLRDRDRLVAAAAVGAFLILAFGLALNMALRQRERLDAERLRSGVVLANALEAMSDGFVMWDEEDRLVTCNQRYRDLYARSAAFMHAGNRFEDVIRWGAEIGQYPEAVGRVEEFVRETVAWHREGRGSIERMLPGGQWLLITERRTSDGGTVGIRTDITAFKTVLADLAAANARANEATDEALRQNAALVEREGRIRFLAHHDDLTKLPNRVLFRERLEAAMRAAEASGQGAALLYLDLDRFKDVNDTLGHPTGDALLRLVADRLRACIKDQDLVARLSGDEFAIMCLDADLPQAAEALSTQIIAELSRPYEVSGHAVVIGVSVGIAVADAARDPDTLLKQADLALYRAKARGRGTSCVFAPEMGARLRERLALEADLRHALARGELALAYQPIYDLAANALCGFECLLRWHHPERGLVSPAVFIPVAEETGAIVEIGAWVLRQACADVVAMPGGLKIAVNLSPLQLASGDIAERVAGVLAETGLEAGRLELEITETALFVNDRHNLEALGRLRALGSRIALDDFGTGYSSLSHLRQFPLDKIKIDRSFVQDMAVRPDSAAIVRSLAGLAHELGMATTAEGIETREQLALIRAAGCTQAQGYLLGKPLPILAALDTVANPRLVLPATAATAKAG
jgi:diguanylate cyclase (GGDEF)-like protein